MAAGLKLVKLLLELIASERAATGWEFYRVNTIGVVTKPGCPGGLLGAKEVLREHYVVTFRRGNPR